MNLTAPSTTHVLMLGHHLGIWKKLGRLLVTRHKLCSDALTNFSSLLSLSSYISTVWIFSSFTNYPFYNVTTSDNDQKNTRMYFWCQSLFLGWCGNYKYRSKCSGHQNYLMQGIGFAWFWNLALSYTFYSVRTLGDADNI